MWITMTFLAYQGVDNYQTIMLYLMWNSFVTVTHAIGLNRFFTFTPEFLQAREIEQATGRFAEGEIPGDQEQTIQEQTPIE